MRQLDSLTGLNMNLNKLEVSGRQGGLTLCGSCSHRVRRNLITYSYPMSQEITIKGYFPGVQCYNLFLFCQHFEPILVILYSKDQIHSQLVKAVIFNFLVSWHSDEILKAQIRFF